MKMEEYLNLLAEQIRCRQARGAVCEEIRDHIEEQKEAFQREGMGPEEAECAAVKEMGDPVEAGTALDRIHRPKMAWGMMCMIGILSIVGLGMQYFVGLHLEDGSSFRLEKQLTFLILGLLLMILVCFADYSRIGLHARELTILTFAGLMVGRNLFGAQINGITDWICFFGTSLDIRMAAMVFVPLYGAILYLYRGQGYIALLKAGFWMLPGLFTVWSCRSILYLMIMFVSFHTLLILAVSKNWFHINRKRTLAGMGTWLILLPLATGGLLYQSGGYKIERIKLILHPEVYSEQVKIVKEILKESRWLGTGDVFLPDWHMDLSDYLLTCIISYFGIVAAVIVTGLVAFLFFHFLRISLCQKNQMGMIMGAGCCEVWMMNLICYVANNLGAMPMRVYCPFLTRGGSGTLILYMMLGLLLSIYRYQNVLPEIKINRPQAE